MMGERRRGLKRAVRAGLVLGSLTLLSSACAPAFGAGALVAVVAVGALTSHCYDYIDVTVLDDQGRKTCAATVTASNGGDEFELKSCYYAPLTDGTWKLRARQPGLPESESTVIVDHANDCTRHVQSLELTLAARGTPAFASPPPTPRAVTPAPAPLPAVTAPEAPPTPPPAAPPAAPSASVPNAAPSVGVFPDPNANPSPAQ